jgi:hypothetical protein
MPSSRDRGVSVSVSTENLTVSATRGMRAPRLQRILRPSGLFPLLLREDYGGLRAAGDVEFFKNGA